MPLSNEVVIARYAEDLDWVGDIPPEFEVVIVNKGAPVTSRRALDRADRVETLANSGRESDTILRHVLGKTRFSDGYTVFLQGDPFEHSPDIIALLTHWQDWSDLQPLSWQYVSSKQLPPPGVLAAETGGFIHGARVRPELYSLMTWGPLQFFDAGTKQIAEGYRALHALPDGINIAGHFLRRCGWDSLAEQADRHLVGQLAYGALFAVRQTALEHVPRESLEIALQAANGHQAYGYILERLWLHMFGAPFLLPAAHALHHAEDLASLPSRFAPVVPRMARPPLHRRVIPGLKRRALAWAES